MKITTWNVNSIRTRLDAVLDWMERNQPDVLCLQETKCTDDKFPWIGFSSVGYQPSFLGQPAYNGVAILSRSPQSDVLVQPVWPLHTEARSISSTIDGLRIVNVYVPYGQEVGVAKFRHKLRWLRRLKDLIARGQPGVVSGDFNVAPDDRDVFDPKIRREKLICSTPERNAFKALLDTGYVDVLRHLSDEAGLYTWWSHRQGALARNHGLRVDHHLVHGSLATRIRSVTIDVDERRRPTPSDHAPVTLILQA